ncbi:hypothetical protein [Cupriavidus sp. D384]|uniref:hypothetical protein n=1 Tax=Cupriavidus sp. D384 TaxID=1538095 RepID=UPI00082E8E76|nr:hypothetical protein [Cupriavidus sp. D384]
MSDIFSTPAFLSQKALRERGIEVKRSLFHEFYASFFGYYHHREMLDDLDEIQFALTQRPLVVLQNHAAYLRMADRLKDQVRADQLQPVFEVVKANLLQVLPPTTFDDEDHLIKTYLADQIKQWLFDDANEEVVEAQTTVAAFCDVFVPDDLDFPDINQEHNDEWRGHFMAMLYHALPDGKPAYLEDQITTTTYIRAEKVGRVILSRDLEMRTVVTAFTPHAAMGGIPLYPKP